MQLRLRTIILSTVVFGAWLAAWLALPDTVAAQEWEIVSEMPQARAGAAVVELDGQVWVIGGRGQRERASTTVFRYDPLSNDWSGVDDLPHLKEARVNATAAVLGRKIFVIGGRTIHGEVLQTVEVFDPSRNEWVDFPDTKRQREGATAIILGSRLYLIGGSDQGERALETVEVFDVANDRWDEISEWKLDRPRVSSAAAVLDASVYIFGGFNTFGPVGQVQQYNSTSGSVQFSEMRVARGALAAVTMHRSIYVIGGRSKDRVLGTTEIFRPSDAGWTEAPSLNRPRHSFSAVRIDQSIYAFGGIGQDGVPLASVEKLGPISTATDPIALPSDLTLEPGFPNPFAQNTRIRYSVSSQTGRVRIDVLDVTGRNVRSLINDAQAPGMYEISWSGDNDAGAQVADGFYLIRMRQGPFTIIRKAVRVAR
jgi:N-acetylneuraminic acid mutarotase